MDVEKRMSLLRECSVCLNKIKINRVLQCQHYFCAGCVEQLLLKEEGRGVHCPMCRKYSEKEFIQQSLIVREVCEIAQNIKDRSGAEDASKSKELDICQEHQLELEGYCVTCRTILCARCIFRDHHDHVTKKVDETVQDISNEVNGYLRLMNGKSEQIQQNQNVTRQYILTLEEAEANAIESVKKEAEEHRKRIDYCEQTLILEIKKQTGDILDTLQGEIKKHEREVTHIKELETRATTTIKNGSSKKVIDEFNGDFLEQLKTSSQDSAPDKIEVRQYTIQFTPCPLTTAGNMIGEVRFIETNETSNNASSTYMAASFGTSPQLQPDVRPKTNMSQANSERRKSFRNVSFKLNSPWQYRLQCVKTLPLDKSGGRLCLYQGKLWLTHYEEQFIGQYDFDGKLLSQIAHKDIEQPKSVHPLPSDHLIVAAGSGLFKVSLTSEMCHCISKGNFHDVQITEHIFALEFTEENDVIRVFEKTPDHKLHNKITLKDDLNVSIHVNEKFLYAAVSNHFQNEAIDKEPIDKIVQYALNGKEMEEYGKHGSDCGEVDNARIRSSDSKECLLIVDGNNRRLQVLDTRKNAWSVVQLPGFTNDMFPCDVAFDGNTQMIVLYKDQMHGKAAIKFYTLTACL